MPAKSHVDLCLFIQILEVDQDKIPTELAVALDASDRRTAEQIMADRAREQKTSPRQMFVGDGTNLHESIHIVQSVIYPFLRWYSMLAFQHVMDAFREVELMSLRIAGRNDESLASPSFMLLDVEYFLWDLSTRSWFGKVKPAMGVSMSETLPPETKGKPLFRLNTTDLIENAASLMQFKISSGKDFPSWIEFQRWSKRNPAYTGVIEFVGRHLGDPDLAVRIFLALVQVAFETNRPVQAFAILLGAIEINLKNGNLQPIISQPDPCRWVEIMDQYLSKSRLEEPEYGNLFSQRFFRLDRFNTSHFRIGGQLSHPIIGEFARRWGILEQTDIAYRYAFTTPNGCRQQVNAVRELFHAPITLLKFKTESRNSVFVTGDLATTGLANVEGAALSERDVRSSLVDFLAIYGIVRRSFNALMDNDFRLCHHKDCPFFEANFCNMWIFIPEHYQDCNFPKRLEFLQNGFRERYEAAPNDRIEIHFQQRINLEGNHDRDQ